MKKAYTEMRTSIRHCCREQKMPMQAALSVIKDEFNRLENKIKDGSHIEISNEVSIYPLLVEGAVEIGRCVHWFLPGREFCEWIVGCVSELDRQHASVIDERVDGEVLCLHFPTTAKLTSLAAWVPQNTWLTTGDRGPNHGMLVLAYSFGNEHDLGSACVQLRPNNEAIKGPTMWYAKLVVGLGMYLTCFPEQVIDGIPSELKHPNHFRKNICKTIGVSPSIVVRDGVCPHFRSGHFRLLKSEHYKHKRGQVVFVHGCFVKGKAETVLSPEEDRGGE